MSNSIIITTITTANIANMRPASSWYLPDTAALTTTTTIITAPIAATIEVASVDDEKIRT
jgi:hypothetical protein